MPFRNIRPLHILWQNNLKLGMLEGVTSGVGTVLTLAGVFPEIHIKYVSTRRQSEWLNPNNNLMERHGFDQHIKWAREKSQVSGYLDIHVLLSSLKDCPAIPLEPTYELVVVNEPISPLQVSGTARKNLAAVMTISHHLHLLQPVDGENEEEAKKRISEFELSTKMLAMHELGHVFGLFANGPDKKNPTEEDYINTHCLNDCVMHFREDPARDKRIADNPFCTSCLENLKNYFLEPPTIIIDIDAPFNS